MMEQRKGAFAVETNAGVLCTVRRRDVGVKGEFTNSRRTMHPGCVTVSVRQYRRSAGRACEVLLAWYSDVSIGVAALAHVCGRIFHSKRYKRPRVVFCEEPPFPP